LCEKGLLLVDVGPAGLAGVRSGLVGEAVSFGVAEPMLVHTQVGSYCFSHVGLDFDRDELHRLDGVKKMACIFVAIS
jgi:hypothetical protein